MWTSLLCLRWHVKEIPILVGLHVPLRRNSPGDISPWFFWLCWYSSPTSEYALSTNLFWTRRPQCNPQDKVRLCTPEIHDVPITTFHSQDSMSVQSERSSTVWGDTPVLGPGVSVNQNMSQVSWNLYKVPASSAYQGCVMSGISCLIFLVSGSILILYSMITRGSPYITPSLLCIIISVPFPFRKTSNE